MFKSIIVLASLAVGALGMKCPDSPVKMHSGCEMTVSFSDSSCEAVQKEMVDRVNGQYGSWYDPHNNGTYAITASSASELSAERLTGDGKYTDLMIFSFSADGAGCTMEACSQSQVSSISDFSTNYCNMHDLYCADAGCHPLSQLKYTESFGKCTAHDDVCAVV